MFDWLIKSFAALNANNRTGEVAAAMVTGITLAMIPAGNLIWVAFLIVTFFLKINFGMQIIIIIILKPIAFMLDPFFDMIGYAVLTIPKLQDFLTTLYNIPIIPFTKFNNTVIIGSILIMTVLSFPLWLLLKKLIQLYRTKIRDRILSAPIIKKIAALPIISTIINLIQKANSLRNS